MSSMEGSCKPVGLAEFNDVFAVRNAAVERLLLDRGLVDVEFHDLVRVGSELFLRHLIADISELSNVAELVILSKGLVYQLDVAYQAIFGRRLPRNLIATRRARVEGDDVKIEVSYESFNTRAEHIILGDTIASGATIVAALERYHAWQPLKSVYIVSFAAAQPGLRRILVFCRTHGVQCKILTALGTFGLADNGFDISFLHPETICDVDVKEKSIVAFEGKQVSCCGWDFGSQSYCVRKYEILCWVEARYWGLSSMAAFPRQVKPTSIADLDLIAGEHAAFASKYPTLEDLLAII